MEENRASTGDEEMNATLPSCRLKGSVCDSDKFPFRSSVDVVGTVSMPSKGCHHNSVPLYIPCGNIVVSGAI